MRHATPVALDAIEPLLARLRRFDALTERKRGVFYRGSSAFLHFHEDPAGFFADVAPRGLKSPRHDISMAERRALIAMVRAQA